MNLFGRIQATCVVSRSTGMLSLLARWFAILETTPVVQLAEPCMVTMDTAPRFTLCSTRRRWLADNSTQQRMQQDAAVLDMHVDEGRKPTAGQPAYCMGPAPAAGFALPCHAKSLTL